MLIIMRAFMYHMHFMIERQVAEHSERLDIFVFRPILFCLSCLDELIKFAILKQPDYYINSCLMYTFSGYCG